MNDSPLTLRRAENGDWLAVDDEQRTVASGGQSRRPGFISVDAWTSPAFDLVAAALIADQPSPLYTVANAADDELIESWRRCGFAEHRRLTCYRIPFDAPIPAPPPTVRGLNLHDRRARIVLRGPAAPFLAVDVDVSDREAVDVIESLGGRAVETNVELVRS
ncbi:MAG: hypothetical protein QM774_06235 [Gordonia sp. (in: high G+C Gram-positive bacteria)]|uniref:hypothetical protein n=1 Tax=Gordonia sp. (in: high G+C Gram-positive bacteria) TaxID=84139 RepID=UPI0039E6445D